MILILASKHLRKQTTVSKSHSSNGGEGVLNEVLYGVWESPPRFKPFPHHINIFVTTVTSESGQQFQKATVVKGVGVTP